MAFTIGTSCVGRRLANAVRRRRLAAALAAMLVAGSLAAAADPWHFTVTADPRGNHTLFANTLTAVNTLAGGPGAFHVSVGDVDNTVPENRAVVDTAFGSSAVWYPVVGNHEEETIDDMTWIRDEYANGNGLRTPLKSFTNENGPAGSVETTYSWDYNNAHFVVLNEYWNGGTAAGSDVAADGDVVPGLRQWLAADLAANAKPYVFVIGHEPAFPANRHIGDSLDANVANRDAFWSLMESYNVDAYLVGHTHYYSRHKGDASGIGNVWQIDAGAAGNGDDETFVDIILSDSEVRYNVYDNHTGTFGLLETWSEPIPEPATLALLAAGCLAILRPRRSVK